MIKGKKIISVFGNSFDQSDFKGVETVLKSHFVGVGEVTARFEEEFKKKIGFKYATAVSSCTNGFWLLLRALNLKPRDEVIIPNIHFFGIKNVLELLHIKYKIVDVGVSVPNVTFEEIRDTITENTSAIIFLEYGGYPVLEMDKIKQYLIDTGRKDILLILDASNSPFTKYKGTCSALNYDYALYSFDMNKILVTGDGGMVLSNNEYVINKIKSFSYYGITDSTRTGFDKSKTSGRWWEIESMVPGLKLDMNNIAASLGLAQLNKIEKILEMRVRVSDDYRRLLRPLVAKRLIDLPPEYEAVENNAYFFWLVLTDEQARDNLASFLLKHNIYVTVKYQPLDKEAKTPRTFQFYSRALNIPLHQNITKAQQKYIIKNIYRFFDYEN
jgi:dTDP-4-amino-4,6-dideoxygalactose transaminase